MATTLMLLALSGCAHAAAPATTKTEPAMAKPAVEVKYAGTVANKPPLMTALVDVTLRNAEKTPRWYVFPGKLPLEEAGADDGVIGAELFDASDKGHVVVARFLGSAAFQAVLLPAGGEVTLQKFAIPVWRSEPVLKSIAFEVIVAKDITIGGEPASAWYGTTVPVADAKASGDVSKAKRAASKKTEDRSEVKVVISEDRRVPVEVAIP